MAFQIAVQVAPRRGMGTDRARVITGGAEAAESVLRSVRDAAPVLTTLDALLTTLTPTACASSLQGDADFLVTLAGSADGVLADDVALVLLRPRP